MYFKSGVSCVFICISKGIYFKNCTDFMSFARSHYEQHFSGFCDVNCEYYYASDNVYVKVTQKDSLSDNWIPFEGAAQWKWKVSFETKFVFGEQGGYSHFYCFEYNF